MNSSEISVVDIVCFLARTFFKTERGRYFWREKRSDVFVLFLLQKRPGFPLFFINNMRGLAKVLKKKCDCCVVFLQ